MSESTSKLSRRNFLLAVGAGGAAGAAAIAAKAVPQAQPVAVRDQKRSTAGYRTSAHIRNYYRTAKV
ncbi:MAG: twin-arginine translocation signal domain-containing protein [Burkholderiales bacterium]